MSTIITGDNILRYRHFVLYSALKLEIVGLKRNGRSAYSIIKKELGFRGNKQKVLQQMKDFLDTNYGSNKNENQ